MDKRLKRSLKVGIPIGLLMASGLGWMFWTSAAYERELQEARKVGLLRTAQELLAKPIPPDENAALVYAEAQRQARLSSRCLVMSYRPGMDSKVQVSIFGRSYTPAEAAVEIDRELVLWKPFFDLVEEGARRSGYAVYVNWDDPDDPFRHDLHPRHFEALTVDAKRKAAKGNIVGALKRVDHLDRIAEHLTRFQPSGNSRGAFRAKADVLCLKLAGSHPEALEYANRRFRRDIYVPDLREELRYTLKSDLVILKTYYRDPMRRGLKADDLSRSDPLLYRSLNESFATTLTRLTREAYEALPDDPLDWRGNRVALAITEAIQGHFVQNLGMRSRKPGYSYLADRYPYALQRQRLSLAALAILKVQNRTGRAPEQLPKEAEGYLEVYTDKPFHYEKTKEGWSVYGAGEDGLDEYDRNRGIHWIARNNALKTDRF